MHLRHFIYKIAYPVVRRVALIFNPRITAVLCIVEHGGKFLFIRNTYGPRVWNFPGGMVKRGEEHIDAARREVKEETGIAIGEAVYLGKHSSNRDGLKNVIIHCFYAVTDNPEIVPDRAEIAEAGWFDKENLPNPQSPAVGRTVELLEQHNAI